jgi:hypothetical protein
LAPRLDEERSLIDYTLGTGEDRPYALAFVGDALVDTQPHASWVERLLPTGERFWDVDLTALAASSVKCETTSIVNASAKGSGKCKGGKVEPLFKSSSKADASKGKGRGKQTQQWKKQLEVDRAKMLDNWTSMLLPGARVRTKFCLEGENDRFKALFYSRTGNRLYSHVEKEGTVLGWDESAGMWAVRMLCGSVWLLRAHHLHVRNPFDSNWVEALDAPSDARTAAPDFARARSFELSKTIESIATEL